MLRYKKYYYESGFCKYNAIRSALSAYLKKYKRKLPEKLTHRDFTNELYRQYKDKPIRKLHKELEDIIVEEIEIPGQIAFHFWKFDEFTEDYKADKLVIVDMRASISPEFYFKGTLAEFKAEYLSSFIHAINEICRRIDYRFFLFEEFSDRKGQRVLYCLLVEENVYDMVGRAEYFDIKQYLTSLDYEFDLEIERPAVPWAPPEEVPPAPPVPEVEKIRALEEERKKIEAERKRIAEEKELIELRRKERAETAKLVREFIEKGFTPEQIMKLFGIKK